MPWKKKTIRTVGPEAPVTHLEIRHMFLRAVAAPVAFAVVTSGAVGAVVWYQALQHSREREHNECILAWQRYDSRIGVRNHFINDRADFLDEVIEVFRVPEPYATAARVELNAQGMRSLEENLPTLVVPNCNRPPDDEVVP